MDAFLKPIADTLGRVIDLQIPGPLFILICGLLLSAVVYLFKLNQDLNKEVNQEIKNGLALADGFRASYEAEADKRNEMYDRLLEDRKARR